MPHYKGHSDPGQRAKAIAGVVTVHAALATVLISGFDVRTVGQVVDRLRTFDISADAPPPPLDPPAKADESSAPEDEAAPANIRSQPTPVVAPDPEIFLPVPLPLNTSRVRGPEGMDRTAGAAAVPGSGTGAGGQGNGFGGGGQGGSGAGNGDGFTPAQRISKIPDREYRRFVAASGMRRGRVGITVKVNTDGRPTNCRVVRSSGNRSVDALMCELTVSHVRFRPARDPQGRPVAQDISWYPDWAPNR